MLFITLISSALCILLLILAFKTRKKIFLSGGLLSMSVFVLFLVLIEGYYRSFLKYEDPIVSGNFEEAYREDAIIGYHLGGAGAMKALSLLPSGDTIFSATYTLVENKFQDGKSFSHRAGYNVESSHEYIFLGCSFTFGEGIPDTSTLAWQFGKLKSAKSVNLGVSGYGVHQIYQMFKSNFGKQNNSNRTFVYSFLSDHFLRATGVHSWNIMGPHFKCQNDSLYYAGCLNNSGKVNDRKWGYYFSLGQSFDFIYDNYERIALTNRIENFSAEDYLYCLNIIKYLAKEIERSGGKLIILNWDNDNWGYRGFPILNQAQIDKDIMALKSHGIQVFTASSILDLKSEENFIPMDGHPTGVANYEMAKVLSEQIE